MKLVVDASVAVKWFVSETLSGEARLLLSHRLELHAPDFLLAEYANVIWKKVRRRELTASPVYTDALSNLSENVALHPIGHMIEHAMQAALDLDHPIYDCLYLACAEATESTLITADEKLANKVASSSLDTDVRYIGSNGFAEEIIAAATAPVIQEEILAQLIEAHDLLAETREGVRTARYGQADRLIIETTEDAKFHLDSPAYRRLVRLFRDLDAEEHIDLLALAWFGRERDDDWPTLFEHACKMLNAVDEHYLLGLGHHWRTGYKRLTGVSL